MNLDALRDQLDLLATPDVDERGDIGYSMNVSSDFVRIEAWTATPHASADEAFAAAQALADTLTGASEWKPGTIIEMAAYKGRNRSDDWDVWRGYVRLGLSAGGGLN